MFLRTYPAVPLKFFFALTLLSPYPAFRVPLTLLCRDFFRTYPAVTLIFFAHLPYECPYPAFRLPLITLL